MMQLNPKIGDKVLLTNKTLHELQTDCARLSHKLPASWLREVTIAKVIAPSTFSFQLMKFTLITDDGYSMERLRDEIIFPLSSKATPNSCNCNLRLLMNRGCQCGTKI